MPWTHRNRTPRALPMDYEQKHLALIAYLRVKVDEGDWHGVSDVANDLRVMEASRLAAPITATEVLARRGKPRCGQHWPTGLQTEATRCQLTEGHGSRHFAQGYGIWTDDWQWSAPLCLRKVATPGDPVVYCNKQRGHSGDHWFVEVKELPEWARPWIEL
jgi:hypothetical protein